MDKVLLIDGMNCLHRACIKFGAAADVEDYIVFTYNFFRNLRATVGQFTPDKIIFCLEGHPQFRYDLYADYKANRRIKIGSNQTVSKPLDEQKEKARVQILELIKYLPITVCRAAQYEADDLIYSLCESMKDEDITVFSNDKDHIQLLQKGYSNVKVFDPIKKEYMVSPEYHFLLFRCLVGDKSDNIPRLVSDKKAISFCQNPQLLKDFLSIEENRANFNINKSINEAVLVPDSDIIIVEYIADFISLKEHFIKFKFKSLVSDDEKWNKYTKTFDNLI